MLRRLLIRYEWLIFMGIVLIAMSISNVLGLTDVDWGWCWVIAGCIVVGEGIIELYYESKAPKEE